MDDDPDAAMLEILDALVLAFDRRRELLEIVADARSADEARAELVRRWQLSEGQATAVLDLQVRRLATLERDRIIGERDRLRDRER